MTAKFNPDKFPSFIEPRHLALAVIMLFGLTLAGPPRLWGQCPPITHLTASVEPKTVTDQTTDNLTVKVTLDGPAEYCNASPNPDGFPGYVTWSIGGGGGTLYTGSFYIDIHESSKTITLTCCNVHNTAVIEATLYAGYTMSVQGTDTFTLLPGGSHSEPQLRTK